MKFQLILRYASVPVIISLVILYLCCLIPPNDIPDVGFEFLIPTDKIVHFLMYMGLSGATAFNYIHAKRGHINMLKLLVFAFAFPILYGGLIEIIQHYYFPPRSGDWFDFLADALGALSALPFAFIFRNYLIKRSL
ncbi:VanZ family protein [Dysgonomonas macrotermitis]|uniref:VanZ like family protein n=1 Tax=Dysgonomonas macrotermitis TaxID=1346286 RepID=A0A1M5APJ7_9BACT|nr:VanZ family protein [Dysgonomonas macrotermitis]SHF32027.1 hypothetical protein SAMN05444362_105117 [Dysgonomonas macrotermitis]